MGLSGLEIFHLEKFCVENNLDFAFIDYDIDYYENRENLRKLAVNKEIKFNNFEDEDTQVMNDEKELELIRNGEKDNNGDETYTDEPDVDDLLNVPKVQDNKILVKRVKNWVWKQRSIEISWDRKLKDKRKSYVRSCQHDVKTLMIIPDIDVTPDIECKISDGWKALFGYVSLFFIFIVWIYYFF